MEIRNRLGEEPSREGPAFPYLVRSFGWPREESRRIKRHGPVSVPARFP